MKLTIFIFSIVFAAFSLEATIEWGEQHQEMESKKAAVLNEENRMLQENLEFDQAQQENFERRTPEPYGGFYKRGGFSQSSYYEGFGGSQEDREYGPLYRP